MVIKKMTAHFGALEGKSLELGRGLNVLYAPNESGKSTWCAFLRTMLYGLDTAQRAKQGQQPDKVKYRPWSGAPMSGSMDVETQAGPVTLRRWTERAAQPMQAFSATVTGTEEPVPGLTADQAGRTLTGAPREVFERSAFISQSGMGVTNDPELEKRFAAIVSAGDEEQSFSQAEGRLRAWQRRRSGRKGAIPELEGELARAQGELDRLDAAARTVEQLERELADAQTRQTELVRHMEQARAEARKNALAAYQAAKRDTEARALAAEDADRAWEEAVQALEDTPFGTEGPEKARARVERDLAQADALLAQADRCPPRWPVFVCLGIGLAAGALAAFLPATAPLLAGAGALLALAGGLFFRVRQGEARRDEQLDRRAEILEDYNAAEPKQVEQALAQYEDLWADAKGAQTARAAAHKALEAARQAQKDAEEPVLNGLDFVSGDNEAARASRAAAEGQARIERLREQRAQAEGRTKAMGDAMVLRSELDEGRRRREALRDQDRALGLALEAMSQADLALRERFSPELARHAAALFGRLTGGRYDEITLARDLSAKARRAGDAVGWETDYLSHGTQDQLYLALRLALCQLVLPEEQACPIVLDDALAAFDSERLGRALDLLKAEAEKRQILLFSCHERESEYFADDPAVTKLTF